VSAWLGVAVPAGWVTYGSLADDSIQIVTNTVTGIAATALLVALLLTRPELRTARRLLPGAAGAAALLLVAAGAAAGTVLPGVDGAEHRTGARRSPHPHLGRVHRPAAARPAPRPWSGPRGSVRRALVDVRRRLRLVGRLRVLRRPAVLSSASVGLAGALVVCAVLTRGARRAATGRTVTGPACPVRPLPARGTARVVTPADLPTAVITLPALPRRIPAAAAA
jgi:hypothetical protein